MVFALNDPPSRSQLDLATECITINLRDTLNDLLMGLIAHAADDKDYAREIREAANPSTWNSLAICSSNISTSTTRAACSRWPS
jgi:hypothetical protein